MLEKLNLKLLGYLNNIISKINRYHGRYVVSTLARSISDKPDRIVQDNDTIINAPELDLQSKVIETKMVRVPRGGFHYVCKMEDISGTTNYVIRSNKESQEAFDALVKEQRKQEVYGLRDAIEDNKRMFPTSVPEKEENNVQED